MKRLLLVRHGETDWNYEHRLQGQQDLPLNETGIQQVELLASHLAAEPFDAAYSSDLDRAYETARIINQHHDLVIRKDERLREIAFGKYEGLTYKDIQSRYPQEYSTWINDHSVATHGGETVGQLGARVGALLTQIEADTHTQTVLIVGHGGPLRMLIALALRMSPDKYWRFRMGNTSVSEVQANQKNWVLTRLNDQTHLSEPAV